MSEREHCPNCGAKLPVHDCTARLDSQDPNEPRVFCQIDLLYVKPITLEDAMARDLINYE